MKRFLLIVTATVLALVFCGTAKGNDHNGHPFDDRQVIFHRDDCRPLDSPFDFHRDGYRLLDSPFDFHRDGYRLLDSPFDFYRDGYRPLDSPFDFYRDDLPRFDYYHDDLPLRFNNYCFYYGHT
jgi:hypothetical protein